MTWVAGLPEATPLPALLLAIGAVAPKAVPPGMIGLILFLYGIGIQFGPQFFTRLRGPERGHNLLAAIDASGSRDPATGDLVLLTDAGGTGQGSACKAGGKPVEGSSPNQTSRRSTSMPWSRAICSSRPGKLF